MLQTYSVIVTCVFLRESVFVESDAHHRCVGVIGQFQLHFPHWRTYSGQDTTHTVHDAKGKIYCCLFQCRNPLVFLEKRKAEKCI